MSCGFQDVEAAEGARERVLDAVEEEREERKEERMEARENVERRGGRAEWRILAAVIVVVRGVVGMFLSSAWWKWYMCVYCIILRRLL